MFKAVGREEIRGTAAEMQLTNRPIATEERRHYRSLCQYAFDVTLAPDPIARDYAIAATVKAGGLAVRNMHVQRQRSGRDMRVTAADVGAKCLGSKVPAKVRHCRVGGV